MDPIEIPKIVPVFPLPTTVLFPKTHLPLHIFEPRYREMIQDVLNADRLIGMALLKEGWEEEYYNNPPIYEIACVGRVVYVQPLEDGRYNIVLFGLSRVKIKDHFSDRNYRQAWVEPLKPPPDILKLPPLLHAELVHLLRDYAVLRGWQKQIESILDLPLDHERLVQLLSAELDFTPIEKQFLLEAEDLVVQSRRLMDLLGFYIQERRAVQRRSILPPNPS